MSLESDFQLLIPAFTRNFANKQLRFAIAAGRSASDFATMVEDTASKLNLNLPKIYRLSTKESHNMYFDTGYDPIRVINGIITSAALYNLDEVLNVHFLEDYSMYGAKARNTDKNLSLTPYADSFRFFYHIMVSAGEIRMKNVDVYRINMSLASYRNQIYN